MYVVAVLRVHCAMIVRLAVSVRTLIRVASDDFVGLQ
jgi:hypothetical protein